MSRNRGKHLVHRPIDVRARFLKTIRVSMDLSIYFDGRSRDYFAKRIRCEEMFESELIGVEFSFLSFPFLLSLFLVAFRGNL